MEARPFSVVHQTVELVPDFERDVLYGTTSIILYYRDEIDVRSKIHLNSQQLKIIDLTVNNLPAEFSYLDPVLELQPSEGDQYSYHGADLDVHLRAGMEISKIGELQITIPDITKGSISPFAKLPYGTSRDLQSTIRHIQTIIENNKGRPFQANPESKHCENDLLDNIINQEPVADNGKIIQIRIAYKIEMMHTELYAGFVFRHQLCSEDDPESLGESEFVSGVSRAAKGPVVSGRKPSSCVYSVSGLKSNRSMLDVDGVRCWMPCVDDPSQRTIFDITIHAPDAKQVLTCGKRVSKRDISIPRRANTGTLNIEDFLFRDLPSRAPSVPSSSSLFPTPNVPTPAPQGVPYSSHRFITSQPIPAASVGFFVGLAETYHMPMYKCKGRIFVALDITDHKADARNSHENGSRSDSRGHVNVIPPAGGAHDMSTDAKRKHEATAASSSTSASSDDKDRYFFEELAMHSVLGCELALRFIHNLTGRRYHLETYTQIYIPDLGVGDYVAFDGFSFVDAKYLHNRSQVFMETPHHLLILSAYLSTWIPSCFPIQSYFHEYLIHGIIGYLVYLYIQNIYGEDEGIFQIVKYIDTTNTLDKMGRSLPLGTPSFPERYEAQLPWYGTYLVNKSFLLFCYIENRIGGDDPIRAAIQHLLQAPLLHSANKLNSQALSPNHPSSPYGNGGGLTRSLSLGSSPDHHPDHHKYHSSELSPTHSTSSRFVFGPNAYLSGSHTPSHFDTYYRQQKGFDTTEGDYGLASPSTNSGALSPFPLLSPTLTTLSSPQQSFLFSPKHRSLDGSSMGLEIFEHSIDLAATFITGERFISEIKKHSGASCNLSDEILEELVYDHRSMYFRVVLEIDADQHGKKRLFHVTIDPIRNPSDLDGHSPARQVDLRMRVFESRDKHVTEPTVRIGDRFVKHSQNLYTRPGRRTKSDYSSQPPNSLSGNAADASSSDGLNRIADENKYSELLDSDECTFESLSLMLQILFQLPVFGSDFYDVSKKTRALNMCRNKEPLIRFILVDPYFLHFLDMNYGGFPDSLLVEQLFNAMDLFDVHRQIQALRGLARSSSSIAKANAQIGNLANSDIYPSSASTNAGDKSAAVQFHALVDCLLGLLPQGDPNPNNTEQSVYVRVEAAFALLQWQLDRAPHVYSSLKQDTWEGAIALLRFLYELCVDPNSRSPIISNGTDEWMTYLKHGVLTATSLIKSQNGTTPLEIIKFYLYLAENAGESGDESLEVDDSHSKATLLSAMSHFRFGDLKSPVQRRLFDRIVAFAVRCIKLEVSRSKLEARLKFVLKERNEMAKFPLGGLVVGAAILCLGELDRQAILQHVPIASAIEQCTSHNEHLALNVGPHSMFNYTQFFLPASGKLVNVFSVPSTATPSHLPKISSSRSSLCPSTVKLAALEAFIRICIASYFASIDKSQLQQMEAKRLALSISAEQNKPPSNSNSNSNSNSAAGNGPNAKTLNVPNASSSSASSSSSTAAGASASTASTATTAAAPENHFLAAALEAALEVIQSDPDPKVRQEAALILMQAIQDMPPRIVAAALSLGHRGMTFGYSDVNAFTLLPCSQFVDIQKLHLLSNRSHTAPGANQPGTDGGAGAPTTSHGASLPSRLKVALCANKRDLRKELRRWWKMMTSLQSHDQVTRSILLTTWLFTFGADRAPKSLVHPHAQLPASNGAGAQVPATTVQQDAHEYKTFIAETFGSSYKCQIPKDPNDSFQRVEMLLRNGSNYKLSARKRGAVKPSAAGGPPPVVPLVSNGASLSLKPVIAEAASINQSDSSSSSSSAAATTAAATSNGNGNGNGGSSGAILSLKMLLPTSK